MLNFDKNGYLTPDVVIAATLEELRASFVVSEKRALLFDGYLNYSYALKQFCGTEYRQWINGKRSLMILIWSLSFRTKIYKRMKVVLVSSVIPIQ